MKFKFLLQSFYCFRSRNLTWLMSNYVYFWKQRNRSISKACPALLSCQLKDNKYHHSITKQFFVISSTCCIQKKIAFLISISKTAIKLCRLSAKALHKNCAKVRVIITFKNRILTFPLILYYPFVQIRYWSFMRSYSELQLSEKK